MPCCGSDNHQAGVPQGTGSSGKKRFARGGGWLMKPCIYHYQVLRKYVCWQKPALTQGVGSARLLEI